jgi:hypothetical protein
MTDSENRSTMQAVLPHFYLDVQKREEARCILVRGMDSGVVAK